jgi:rhomboid family GlyGly-CTERM serine protease
VGKPTAARDEDEGHAPAPRGAALYERTFHTIVIRLTLARTEWAALTGAALIVALQPLDAAGTAFEYRRALLATEPWRVVTAHLVHVNSEHALINAAAWWLVARLFGPDLDLRRQLIALFAGAVAIGAGLALLHPAIDWYRGFSGVLHALFFAGATCWLANALARPDTRTLRGLWLPAALAAGGWIKVALEQPAGSATPYADWLGATIVPQAHLLGALAGTLLGFAFAWRNARKNAATVRGVP